MADVDRNLLKIYHKECQAQLVARERRVARDAFLCFALRRFKYEMSFDPFPGKSKMGRQFLKITNCSLIDICS